MRIKSIEVGGYKNLRRTRLELNGIVAIVSPNNYGKSNLLEAISFGIDFLNAGTKSRSLMMAWKRGIPINKSLADEDFFFEAEFEDETLEEYRFVRYGFSFAWYKDDKSGQRITDEWLDARPSESVRFTSFFNRGEKKYRKSKDTKAFRKTNADDRQLMIDFLPNLEEISIRPIIDMIKHLDFYVCASLDLGERFHMPPIEYIGGDFGEVAFDDADVPRALYHLKKENAEKFELFQEAVFTLFPEFQEIDVQSYKLQKEFKARAREYVVTAGDDGKDSLESLAGGERENSIPFRIRDEVYRLFVTSRYLNQPIDMSVMSTGTKRVIWLLANVFIASARKIHFIGVEELETSIHPRLLKSLLEILDEALEDTSLIISSHSPFLIQYFKPDRIYVGIPNLEGAAFFKQIKASRVKALVQISRDRGLSVGEYLFDLMTGDEDSNETLNFYLEEA